MKPYKPFILLFFLLLTLLETFGQEEVQKYLDKYYSVYGQYKVYLHTDKSIYAKGEKIWISGLLLDRQTHQPVKGKNYVDVNVTDPDGNVFVSKSILFENGKAGSSIIIPDLEAGSKYYVKAAMNQLTTVVFQKEIMILENAIPHFIIDLTYQDKYYTGGDELKVLFKVSDHYNNPLKKVKYEWRLSSDQQMLYQYNDKTNGEGTAIIAIRLPDPLPKEDVVLYTTFEKGISEETVVWQIPVRKEDLDVDFYPESGASVAGLENQMKIKVRDEYGRPVAFEGKVLNDKNEIVTSIAGDDAGISEFIFTPDPNQKLKLQITKPYELEKAFDFPSAEKNGVTFNYKFVNEDSITFNFKSNYSSSKSFKLSNIYRGKVVSTETLSFKENFTKTFAVKELYEGLNQITLFDDENAPLAEQLIFIPSKNQITAKTEKDHYDNRSKVNVVIDYSAPSLLTLSARDEYRLLKDVPAQNIISYLNVDSETNDHIVFEAQNLQNFQSIKNINEQLQAVNSCVSWKDIYSFNDKTIEFGKLYKRDAYKPLKTNLFVKGSSEEFITLTNFDHNTFYLGSNPILLERLEDKAKKEKSTPYYKQLLNSGGSILDAIYSIKQFDIVNNKIVFPGTYNSLMAQGGALIVVDGIRLGENISALSNLNPFSIDEIFVSTKPLDISRYTGLNSVGLVEITTKRGEMVKKEPVDESDKFESPDYENDPDAMKNEDDIRTTIYWMPFFKPENKPEDIFFFHSDIRTNVVGIVEGINEEGNPVYDEFNYESYNYSKENQ